MYNKAMSNAVYSALPDALVQEARAQRLRPANFQAYLKSHRLEGMYRAATSAVQSEERAQAQIEMLTAMADYSRRKSMPHTVEANIGDLRAGRHKSKDEVRELYDQARWAPPPPLPRSLFYEGLAPTEADVEAGFLGVGCAQEADPRG